MLIWPSQCVHHSCQADKIDTELITLLSYTCRGLLTPLAAAMGGIVAQEVLKALTGKFTPLKQWVRQERNHDSKAWFPFGRDGGVV